MSQQDYEDDDNNQELILFQPLPPPAPTKPLHSLSQLHDVMHDDISRVSYMLKQMDNIWATVTHPEEVCKLVLTQTKLLETRRKLMMLPYGDFRKSRTPHKDDDFFEN